MRPEAVDRRLVRFARALHAEGLAVDPSRVIDLCRCLEVVDIGDRAAFRAAARATLVARRDDLPVFDRLFDAWWTLDPAPPGDEAGVPDEEPAGTPDEGDDAGEERSRERFASDAEAGEPAEEDEIGTGWSADEVLMTRNLGQMSDAELERARRLLADLVAVLATVRGRRWAPAGGGARLDLRRMLRRHALYGRDAVDLLWRRRPPRRLRLMLLCDVSGSMERYSSFLVQFMYALRRELPQLDVGVFATRMTFITELLDDRDLAGSLARVTAQVRDWGGGTDIGKALGEFNDRHARAMLRSKTIAVILSDGWDRGDAQAMRLQIERLRRCVHRLVWLNPLLGTEGYEPLCRGIRTALPHLDYFLPAHNLASLAAAARTLRTLWH